MSSQSSKSLGKFGENYACEVLAKKGHKILARNFHSRYGEIDIISEKGSELYFFEVKTRKTNSLNYPEESITYRKKQKMLKTAYKFLEKQNNLHKPFSKGKSLPGQTSSPHKTLRFYLFGILLDGQKIKKIECLPIFE